MSATTWPMLSMLLIVPLAGALFVFVTSRTAETNIKFGALWATGTNLLISLIVLAEFDVSSADFQIVEEVKWFGDYITYRVGVDGISILFVILTTALMPFVIIASWSSVSHRLKEYMIAFLVLETVMIGVFIALDLVLFYVFFEAGLIPMFLIIGIWGGKRRIYASFKFFLYTLLGSVLMLLAMIVMYNQAGTADIRQLLTYHFDPALQTWLFLAFLASFAVKLPMWPVHTWLPDAHVEAPTGGSVVLAAILLKMGGYGFLRFSLPMFPLASEMFAPMMFALSVMAIIYTSLVALAQEDVKKLIAYSSVAHMGFVTLGIFTFTMQGMQGGIIQMISHGIVSAALFLCVGVIYDRMHTREIAAYGGLVNRMPVYAFMFMVFTLANTGLPGTSGFVGEFMTLLAAFQANSAVAVLATTGVIFSAAYALWLYRRIIFGDLVKDTLKSISDVNAREIIVLGPMVALTILFGVYPRPLMVATEASVENLVTQVREAQQRGRAESDEGAAAPATTEAEPAAAREPATPEPALREPYLPEPASAEPESVEPESVEPESVEPESAEPESAEPEPAGTRPPESPAPDPQDGNR